MQLLAILITATSLLAVLSGISIMFGGNKNDESSGFWFCGATVGAAIWAISIAAFLSLPTTAQDLGPVAIKSLYIGAVLMDIFLMFYICWQYPVSRFFAIALSVLGLFLIVSLLINPSLLYSSIIVSNDGNSAQLVVDGWYYWLYALFFVIATLVLAGTLLFKIGRTKIKKNRIGYIVFLVGFSITGTLSLVFDIILPVTRYDLIWIGPLAISVTILTFYYSIVRYRILSLSSQWLKTLSFVILVISATILYLVIFFAIFSALFRTSTPSLQVVLLNFLMAIIVLLLLPFFTELYAAAKSRMATQKIDISYIVKKISKIDRKKERLADVAGFLADHLHFSYVGILINGRLYGSSSLAISAEELEKISKMKSPKRGIWHEIDEPVRKILNNLELNEIAELTDAKGNEFGQFIIGKPVNKTRYDRRELIQLEMIINLVATVLD